jgi:mitogen-activated protein kinase kinase kinase 1
VEGVHWIKGKLIGAGAYCSCYLARDMDNGTMFAVKQVSVCVRCMCRNNNVNLSLITG